MAGALALPVAARAGAIRTVKALNWEGVAELVSGGRTLHIHVKTRVEPFIPRARSETYLVGDPTQVRTLIIEPEGGWTERDGARTPLPEAQTRHERQQYAIYGFILAAQDRADGKGLRVTRGGYPPFDYDAAQGRVTEAHYPVDAPDGNGSIDETIRCSDWRDVNGLAWPHRIGIEEQPSTGAPSLFTLTIDTLTVEYA